MRRAWKAAASAALLLLAGALPAVAQERVLVPARVIYPGETIDLSSLREVTLKAGRAAPAGVAVTVDTLDGKVARRTLLPGRYIASNSVREAYAVEQGATVKIEFVASGLTISATAVTLQPGAIGEIVRVRNVDSGKILSGIVLANGTVRVGAS